MPLVVGRTLLKRWRYVGVFAPELMISAADIRVGPLPRRWWAIAEPDGTLREGAGAGRGGLHLEPGRLSLRRAEVRVELALDEGAGIEVASPTRGAYGWTRKQGGVRAHGRVALAERVLELDAEAVVDESAGYHDRRTAWLWSAGVGRGGGGERLAWNLVSGLHDSPEASERTVWVDAEPREVGPVEFRPDLSGVELPAGGSLSFSPWCAREERLDLLLVRSAYRQPFGTFAGQLPGGLHLAAGYGVMERHEALW
jgi:Protein of unknown function (DUF2804)